MRFLEISNEFQRAGIENSKAGVENSKAGIENSKQGLKVERTNDIPEQHEVAISEVQGREALVEKSKAGVESSRTNEDNEVDIGEVQVRKVGCWEGDREEGGEEG